MSSNSFQITRNAHLNPLAQRYNAESAEGPETSTESNAKTVFTGEFRTPIRERIQSMRRSKGVPAPVRPGTPVPDKRIRPTTPQTPAALPHMPECPGAPRKSKKGHEPAGHVSPADPWRWPRCHARGALAVAAELES